MGRSEPSTAAVERIVVLLLPEALGDFADAERLKQTLRDSQLPVRVLLCLPDASGYRFATMLEELGVETEILLGDGVAKPPVQRAFALNAPPGMTPDDLTEFALALSDVVLVSSRDSPDRLNLGGRDLAKQRIVPGEPLKGNQSRESVTRVLDCDAAGLHSIGRRWFGRVEQAILESIAFNWRGTKQGGMADSRKRLRRCFGLAWRPRAYFAPPGWEQLVPDAAAREPTSKIVSSFEAMDRSALYGSHFHRDLTWLAHFCAAFAILAAVIGHLRHGHLTWGVAEIVALGAVAVLIVTARQVGLQDRWTACRLGAEQLRIARMSLPLLVLPPALATTDAQPPESGQSSREVELGFQALSEVKRIVRDHGLPRPRTDLAATPVNAARWLRLIVADQVHYHRVNHHKLEAVEDRITAITEAMFWIIMACVLAHLWFHWDWLFVIIAAGPAFAAALHGAATRLGVVHRMALSQDVERKLTKIDAELSKLIDAPPADSEAWPQVRGLAYQAAEAMGSENMSWHVLVRRYADVLP